jgi:3-methyladenine DNA glycosylase AlkD
MLDKKIESVLKAAGTPARAKSEKAYLKSELLHFGVPMPLLRKHTLAALKESGKPTRAELLDTVTALWARGIHELRAAAIELLLREHKLLTSADLKLVERLLRESKTWAYVDVLAVDLVGGLLARAPALTKTLDRWAKDDDFWIRRSAMLALLRPLRKGEGDFERFGRYADAMLEEKEFFIRKAIGWILRETSKKQPKIVADWLMPRAARASGVTMREAVKYLPAGQKAELMKRYQAP